MAPGMPEIKTLIANLFAAKRATQSHIFTARNTGPQVEQCKTLLELLRAEQRRAEWLERRWHPEWVVMGG